MANFFRVQGKGYSIEDMKTFNSANGGDGLIEGLCVSDTPDGNFGGAWDAMNDDDEIVILTGTIIAEIYDGYRIIPATEIARFTIAEWKTKLRDGSAWDYEEW